MVGAIFLKLDSSEEMNIRGMCIHIAQTERHFGLGDGLILLWIVDQAFLDEITTSAAPAGPETEFEKSYRETWCRDRTDHPHQCLLAADFGSHILAEDGCL